MDIVRSILPVALVFGLMGVVLWKLKGFRPMPKARSRTLQSIDRLALTPQHTLHLIRLDGTEFAIVTHSQGCTQIDFPMTRTAPPLPAGFIAAAQETPCR
jgi:hypothetical protein